MLRTRALSAAATAILLMHGSLAAASSGGRVSNTYDGTQGCNQCHNGGSVPTVELTGPASVAPGTQHELTFTVSAMGSQTHAGLNAFAPSGTFATGGSNSTGTQTAVGTGGRLEITHTAPKMNSAGTTTFSMLWTAPATAFSSVTISAWGNSVDNGGTFLGTDKAAKDTLTIFSSNNGGSCTAGTQCLSGNCVDSVCCASASCAMGEVCNAVGSEGTCAPGPTATPMPTPTATPTRFPIESFKLYKVKVPSESLAPGDLASAQTITDPFESKVIEIFKPTSLGNPVDVGSGAALNTTAHLQCFKSKDQKSPPQPKFAGRIVQTSGPIESRRLELKKAIEVCLMSNSGALFVPPVSYATTHYRCYKAKDADGQAKFVSFETVLDDEFEAKTTVLLKPDRLCSPMTIGAEIPDEPTVHLLCYKIKDSKNPAQTKFAGETRFVRNYLTGTTELFASKSNLLCSPVTAIDEGAP